MATKTIHPCSWAKIKLKRSSVTLLDIILQEVVTDLTPNYMLDWILSSFVLITSHGTYFVSGFYYGIFHLCDSSVLYMCLFSLSIHNLRILLQNIMISRCILYIIHLFIYAIYMQCIHIYVWWCKYDVNCKTSFSYRRYFPTIFLSLCLNLHSSNWHILV